ncbi:MAG: hypothetical protein LIR10_06675 [Bacillota bacterium]|nr:hypothetical protein [Bacillota bacterium]
MEISINSETKSLVFTSDKPFTPEQMALATKLFESTAENSAEVKKYKSGNQVQLNIKCRGCNRQHLADATIGRDQAYQCECGEQIKLLPIIRAMGFVD